MQQHDWSSTSPKEPMLHLSVSLHWLPVAARIKFKTLMLAYRPNTSSSPTHFHSLLRIYIPSRSLRSASERRLVVPSQRGSKSLSRTFSFTVPGRWNDLPTPIRNTGSLSIFKQPLKTWRRTDTHYLRLGLEQQTQMRIIQTTGGMNELIRTQAKTRSQGRKQIPLETQTDLLQTICYFNIFCNKN